MRMFMTMTLLAAASASAQTTTRPWLYQQMTPQEVQAAVQAMPVAYLPAGIVEWHGEQSACGLDALKEWSDVVVYHAATKREDGHVLTVGGRVLGVTALGANLESAIARAYEAIGRIHFEGMTYRRDIGARALARLHGSRPA